MSFFFIFLWLALDWVAKVELIVTSLQHTSWGKYWNWRLHQMSRSLQQNQLHNLTWCSLQQNRICPWQKHLIFLHCQYYDWFEKQWLAVDSLISRLELTANVQKTATLYPSQERVCVVTRIIPLPVIFSPKVSPSPTCSRSSFPLFSLFINQITFHNK